MVKNIIKRNRVLEKKYIVPIQTTTTNKEVDIFTETEDEVQETTAVKNKNVKKNETV
jgi:hypothetical protein